LARRSAAGRHAVRPQIKSENPGRSATHLYRQRGGGWPSCKRSCPVSATKIARRFLAGQGPRGSSKNLRGPASDAGLFTLRHQLNRWPVGLNPRSWTKGLAASNNCGCHGPPTRSKAVPSGLAGELHFKHARRHIHRQQHRIVSGTCPMRCDGERAALRNDRTRRALTLHTAHARR